MENRKYRQYLPVFKAFFLMFCIEHDLDLLTDPLADPDPKWLPSTALPPE